MVRGPPASLQLPQPPTLQPSRFPCPPSHSPTHFLASPHANANAQRRLTVQSCYLQASTINTFTLTSAVACAHSVSSSSMPILCILAQRLLDAPASVDKADYQGRSVSD